MVFIRDGNLIYNSEHRQKFRHIEPGDWLSEMSLWMREWIHLGALCASTYCNVVALDARIFQQTIVQFHTALKVIRDYARELARRLDELALTHHDQDAQRGSLVDDVDSMLDLEAIAAGLGTHAGESNVPVTP